jgi:hypothetical protein
MGLAAIREATLAEFRLSMATQAHECLRGGGVSAWRH